MNNSKNGWMLWVGLAVVIAVVLIGLLSLGDDPDQSLTVLAPVSGIAAGDAVRGNASSTVVLIEYGDYQCPACAYYDPLVNQLVKEYGDKIAFVYRQFPLRQIHKNAEMASRAVVAAAEQGMMWQMHELLYSRQRDWSTSIKAQSVFTDYAQGLGMNVAQFTQAIESDATALKVESDLQSGLAASVNGTPTFFLNGKKLVNPSTYEQFAALIEAQLQVVQ